MSVKRSWIIPIIVTVILVSSNLATMMVNSSTNSPSEIEKVSIKSMKKYPLMYLYYPPENNRVHLAQSSEQPKIILDAGHDQYYTPDRLSEFVSLISIFGDIVVNYDQITSEDLTGASLLIIPNPEGEFTPDEVSAIHAFLENGGSLYIMGTWHDYFDPQIANAITEKYGIVWDDVSVQDNTTYFTHPDYNAPYYPLVHVWANNSITREMGILENVKEIFFSGTNLRIVTPTDPSKVLEGPYPIGVGDDDTFVVFENGTSKLLDGDVIFFAAVKLVGGGKIFASGTTYVFAYDRVRLLDNRIFTLLTVGWTLNLTPEDSLIPLIESFSVSKENYILGDTGTVSVKIKNLANASKENVSINLLIPYFLEVVDSKVTVSRESGTYDITYVPGEMINFGTLAPLEIVTVSFTVKCVLGLKRDGFLGVQLYLKGSKIGESTISVSSSPAFDTAVSFDPFPLNLTLTNKTLLYVRVKNIATYTIRSIEVRIPEVPPDVSFNATEALISSLAPGEEKTVTFEVTTTSIGAYSIAVYIKTENGGEDVARAVLVATTTRIIVFDEGHYQFVYFTSQWMGDFIDLLLRHAPVLILKGTIPAPLLDPSVTAIYVLPIPQPSTGSPGDTTTPIMSDEEVRLIQQYLESGGSVLMMGNWYQYFWPDNPGGFNEITGKYGLKWIDGDVYDPVNYIDATYHVVAKTFAKNEIAKILTAGISQIEFAGTALIATNTSIATHYPVVIGNNESYVTDDQGNILARGKDVLMIVASIIAGKGKLLASGSVYAFSSRYYYKSNEPFIANVITWLLGIKQLDIEISGVPYQVNIGEDIVMRVKVTNKGVETLVGIQVAIDYSPGIINRNGTKTYSVGDLEPGEYAEIVWILSANAAGTYRITVNASASNLPSPTTKEIIVNYVKPRGKIPASGLIAVSVIIVLVVVFGALALYIRRFKKS
ncbi:MAG: hypothetical protein ACTSX9_09400 [Candidatus Njordarchaeales archaeon]